MWICSCSKKVVKMLCRISHSALCWHFSKILHPSQGWRKAFKLTGSNTTGLFMTSAYFAMGADFLLLMSHSRITIEDLEHLSRTQSNLAWFSKFLLWMNHTSFQNRRVQLHSLNPSLRCPCIRTSDCNIHKVSQVLWLTKVKEKNVKTLMNVLDKAELIIDIFLYLHRFYPNFSLNKCGFVFPQTKLSKWGTPPLVISNWIWMFEW